MKKILYFQYIHIRRQFWMYLLPCLFIYVILIPYQKQILLSEDFDKLIRVFDISQKYLCLFYVWIQYLAWRYLLNVKQREIVRFEAFGRGSWFLINLLFSTLIMSGYFLWLANASGRPLSVCILLAEFSFTAIDAALLYQLTGNPLTGLGIMMIYLFLCTTHHLPAPWAVIHLDVLPNTLELTWVLCQSVIAILLLVNLKIKRRILS